MDSGAVVFGGYVLAKVNVYPLGVKRHLHRYLAEFDFRYSNRKATGIDDSMRADIALRGIVGKRLTYETIGV